MAVTADTVSVRLEADTDAYIRGLAVAEKDFVASMNRMSQAAVKAGTAVALPFEKLPPVLGKAKPAVDGLNTSMKTLGGSVANVGYQFNDIGVQLLGGQAPLLIAFQQGTQLNQIFQQLLANGGGIGSSLTAAFSQVINPISLATIGIIALGGYAVQYFLDIVNGGKDANLTLEEQNTLLRSLADRWGEAAPALKAYVDELDRAKEKAEDIQGQKIFTDAQFADARASIGTLQGAIGALVQDLRAAGEEDESIIRIQTAVENLTKSVEDGKDPTKQLKDVQDALAETVNSNIPGFESFTQILYGFAKAAQTAADESKKLNDQFRARELLAARQGIGGPLAYSNDGGVPDGTNVPTPDRKPSQLGEYPGGGFSKPKKAKKDTEDAYESFTRKIREQTDATNAQIEAEAKLNPLLEDYGLAANSARLYQEGLNAAKKAGIDLSPAELEALRLTTEGLALVRAEQEKNAEANKKIKQSFEAWNETAKSTVTGLIDDLLSGASAADTFKNALGGILDQLIKIGTDKIFDSKTGIFSQLFSGLFSGGTGGGADPWAGMRANGGPVVGGQTYVVGERGPELFAPGVAGSIIPNVPNVSPGGSGGSGGGEMAVRVFVDDDAKLQAVIDRRASNVASQHVARSQAGEVARLPGNLKTANQRGLVK